MGDQFQFMQMLYQLMQHPAFQQMFSQQGGMGQGQPMGYQAGGAMMGQQQPMGMAQQGMNMPPFGQQSGGQSGMAMQQGGAKPTDMQKPLAVPSFDIGAPPSFGQPSGPSPPSQGYYTPGMASIFQRQ